MSDKKEYLGDGVYVDLDQWDGTIRLTTEDGIRVTNEIFIDAAVWNAFLRWVEKVSRPPVISVSLEQVELITNAPDDGVVSVQTFPGRVLETEDVFRIMNGQHVPRTYTLNETSQVFLRDGFPFDVLGELESMQTKLAAAESALNECRSDLASTVSDWKDAHDGKLVAETAAFFLLEVCKHTDEVRYEQALKHWPFLNEARAGGGE